MMPLNYYLNRGARGDKHAAYEAARLMHLEKYSEVMVQAQLRKAASMGSVDAMRWLGLLGLSGYLITPESSISHVSYYPTLHQAYHWFSEGARHGDAFSIFVVGTCLRHGIGTVQDTEKSQAVMATVPDSISIDTVIPILYLVNALHASGTPGSTIPNAFLAQIQNSLSSQGGQHGEDH